MAKKIENEFKHLWKVTTTSRLGDMMFNVSDERVFPVLKGIHLSREAKIIDVGCASGRTLQFFRSNGFQNSVGVDVSRDSIKMCNNKGFETGKDVFLSNITENKFKASSFDLVFAEGLLEHFKDMQPVVDAMCRLSKNYVLILQPNHTSISLRRYVYRFLEISYIVAMRRTFVYEIPYTVKDYENAFEKAGFKLVKSFDLVMKSGWGLLFKKVN